MVYALRKCTKSTSQRRQPKISTFSDNSVQTIFSFHAGWVFLDLSLDCLLAQNTLNGDSKYENTEGPQLG